MGSGNTSLVGAILEKRAALWLLEQGYLVFENVAPVGAADLVAVAPDGRVLLIDVKSVTGRPNYIHWPKLTPRQQELGVIYLTYVNDQWLFIDPDQDEAINWPKDFYTTTSTSETE